jgi:tetratricopeptide (TPR) repeat protein/tRNA A-37 threonylcarbamoyl transferase component Bud32
VENGQFGHYRVIEKLGEGGMGEVWKAQDETLDREVALKVLRPAAMETEHARARFEREARAISHLNHPNIATIHAIEEIEGRRFLVLEYLPGGSLRKLVAKGPLPMEGLLDAAAQLARGLAHAHRHGVIHRDIKPDNALRSEEGLWKLTDFGLARPDGEDTMTMPGSVLGTAAYVAPEVAQGQAADARSDIFSFGVMLYEMAAGRRPFQADTPPGLLYAVVHSTPQSPQALRADVPAGLAALIARMLEKEPSRRLSSMDEAVAALEALRAGSAAPTESMASTRRVYAGPWWRRRAVLAAVGVALVSMVLSLTPWREWLVRWLNPLPERKRVAVLPLRAIEVEEWLCEGLTATLVSSLTRRQVPRQHLAIFSAFALAQDSPVTVDDARRKFGANLVFAGDLQRVEERLRLTLNLIDAKSGRQLRSEIIDQAKGMAEFQEEAARRASLMLELELAPALAQAPAASDAVYEAYIQGEGRLARYDQMVNIQEAMRHFRRAAAIDGSFAPAWAGLAKASWRAYELSKENAYADQAMEASQRALKIDPQLTAAHVAAGMVQLGTGNYERAQREFEQALEQEPVNNEALRGLAAAAERQKQYDRAEKEYRRAALLRPEDWATHSELCRFLYRRDRFGEAEHHARRVIELIPEAGHGYQLLGSVLLKLHRDADFIREMERGGAISGSPAVKQVLAYDYFQKKRYADAVRLYREVAKSNPNGSVHWANLADALRWNPPTAAEAPQVYRTAIALAQNELAVNPRGAKTRARMAFHLALVGEKGAAQREIANALRLAEKDKDVHYQAALVEEQTGNREKALERLARAVTLGYSQLDISRDPELAPLRADPRYTAAVPPRGGR